MPETTEVRRSGWRGLAGESGSVAGPGRNMTLINGNGPSIRVGAIIQTVAAALVAAAIIGMWSDVREMRVEFAAMRQAERHQDWRLDAHGRRLDTVEALIAGGPGGSR
jgi:hypothetical protein